MIESKKNSIAITLLLSIFALSGCGGGEGSSSFPGSEDVDNGGDGNNGGNGGENGGDSGGSENGEIIPPSGEEEFENFSSFTGIGTIGEMVDLPTGTMDALNGYIINNIANPEKFTTTIVSAENKLISYTTEDFVANSNRAVSWTEDYDIRTAMNYMTDELNESTVPLQEDMIFGSYPVKSYYFENVNGEDDFVYKSTVFAEDSSPIPMFTQMGLVNEDTTRNANNFSIGFSTEDSFFVDHEAGDEVIGTSPQRIEYLLTNHTLEFASSEPYKTTSNYIDDFKVDKSMGTEIDYNNVVEVDQNTLTASFTALGCDEDSITLTVPEVTQQILTSNTDDGTSIAVTKEMKVSEVLLSNCTDSSIEGHYTGVFFYENFDMHILLKREDSSVAIVGRTDP